MPWKSGQHERITKGVFVLEFFMFVTDKRAYDKLVVLLGCKLQRKARTVNSCYGAANEAE